MQKNIIHNSIAKASFEVIEGQPKLPLLLRTHNNIFATNKYIHAISVAFGDLKETIACAQDKQKRPLTNTKGIWL